VTVEEFRERTWELEEELSGLVQLFEDRIEGIE